MARGNGTIDIGEWFGNTKADYQAANRSGRLRRKRCGIPQQGASGDYHYRNESDHLWMGEIARDIDRNDVVVGQTIDRAVDNIVQGGFVYEPKTGDTKLDQDLKDWWAEESNDPAKCDAQGQFTFADQERFVCRDALVVGDIFGIPIDDGTVQLTEFHRCRSPHGTKRNIVHGVEMDDRRRRINYYFTKDVVDPNSQGLIAMKDLTPVPAFGEDGLPNVWQVFNPKRSTQTRGVTALAPLFDAAGIHDDLQFAKLVQAQSVSFYAFLRQRDSSFDPSLAGMRNGAGESETVTLPNGGQRIIEGKVPGLELTSLPGERIEAWSPSVPNPEFFPHVRLILTFIGINLGLPLVMVLMDASETNFSGFRGAVDQARLQFRCNQKSLMRRWHVPYITWKLHRLADTEPTFNRIRQTMRVGRKKANLFAHAWNPPQWPYIEPVKDATADLVRDANMQTSLRRRHAERGARWADIATETVEDRALAISMAVEKAQEINAKYGLEGDEIVHWQSLAPLPNPEGLSVSIQAGAGTNESSTDGTE